MLRIFAAALFATAVMAVPAAAQQPGGGYGGGGSKRHPAPPHAAPEAVALALPLAARLGLVRLALGPSLAVAQ